MPGIERDWVAKTLDDPDGCLVRSSKQSQLIRNYKIKEKTGAKTQAGGTVMGSTMQKKRIFVTEEVFFLDISLLMGAIGRGLGAVDNYTTKGMVIVKIFGF